MKPIDVLVERGGDPDAVAARLRAVPGVVGREPGLAGRAELVRRGVPGDRRRRARHPGDHRPLERGARRDRRDRDGPRRRRPRLRPRPVRPAAVRGGARADPDAGPAHPRLPVDRAPAQGRAAEPRLARRVVRRRRARLPAGARLGAVGRARDAVRDRLDPGDDLRLPLRPLDGLRGVHAQPDARGVRRDRLDRPGDRARARPHREARHQRGADPRASPSSCSRRARATRSSRSRSASRPGSSSTRPSSAPCSCPRSCA